MSGGVIFQETLRIANKSGLHELAERDVLRSLQAARIAGPLDLLYDCAAAASANINIRTIVLSARLIPPFRRRQDLREQAGCLAQGSCRPLMKLTLSGEKMSVVTMK